MGSEIGLQVGETYLTRSGAKVTIREIKTTRRGGMIAVGDFERGGSGSWALNGSYRYMEEHDLDLVAEVTSNEKALVERLREADRDWALLLDAENSQLVREAADAIERIARERDDVLAREAATQVRHDERIDVVERGLAEALAEIERRLSPAGQGETWRFWRDKYRTELANERAYTQHLERALCAAGFKKACQHCALAGYPIWTKDGSAADLCEVCEEHEQEKRDD
jgi:hypothetical protein